MKKYLFSLIAVLGLGLTACEDVPEPYMINTTPSGSGGETGNDSILLSETFSSSLGEFTSVSTVGEYDWLVSYSCAQITSYNSSDKTNNAADSWLISKALDFSDVTSAHINFEYILRYANSAEVNTNYLCLISKDYSGDPASATWTTLNFKPKVGTDWNTWYESGDIAVPAEYCGASSVVVALRYIATTKSATWEVRNFVCARGEAQAGETTEAVATGDGTRANPYNAVAANEVIASGDIPTDKVYVKGKVSSINKIDTSYGNATYYISDDGTTDNQFYIYRGYALGGAKFTSEDELNVGDEVVVYGNLINYNGTYEMTQGSIIVELNGVSSEGGSSSTTTGTATGSGTLDDPYNSVAANKLITDGNIPSDPVYVKGKVVSIKELSTSYGNASYYISDDGTSTDQFYVYRGYALGNTKFTSEDQLSVGDEVVVYGTLMSYNGTPEMKQGNYIVKQNGSTSGSSSEGGSTTVAGASGSGTEADPYNVAGAQQQYANSGTTADQYVQGYIVGYVDGKTLSSGATFNAESATSNTNILIADDASCTDYTKCLPIQLPKGNVRTGLNLQDNPGNLGKKVLLKGSIDAYFGTTGLKSPASYSFAE